MALDRRLQILLDEQRYRRLSARARERKSSVAAVIREAIDIAFPDDVAKRRAAADALLAADPIPVPDVKELKREIGDSHKPGL